jgi:hypothetical protein
MTTCACETLGGKLSVRNPKGHKYQEWLLCYVLHLVHWVLQTDRADCSQSGPTERQNENSP